jgi:hypothetical protein
LNDRGAANEAAGIPTMNSRRRIAMLGLGMAVRGRKALKVQVVIDTLLQSARDGRTVTVNP